MENPKKTKQNEVENNFDPNEQSMEVEDSTVAKEKPISLDLLKEFREDLLS